MKETVIQFGEGGFLRGFADWMLQALNEKTDFCGSVVVVQPIKDGLCDTLSAQNCVYTHIIRGVEGVEVTLIDSISRCVKPYDDFGEYLALAENPDFKLEPLPLPEVFPENESGMLLLVPGQYDTDGFFICRLRRNI